MTPTFGRREKTGKEFNRKMWKLIKVSPVPQQGNGYDCGVFTCAFAEYLGRWDESFNFTQTDVTRLRKGIALSILNGKEILREIQ